MKSPFKAKASFILMLLSLVAAACSPQLGPGATQLTTPTLIVIATQAPSAVPATPPAQEDNLANTGWTLSSYGKPGAQTPVVASAKTTLSFDAEGRVSGSGGCNSYGGQYRVAQGMISFQQVVSTMMACTDPQIMQQEQQYFKALESTGKFEISADRLTIAYDSGQALLTFAKGIANPIPPTSVPNTGSSQPTVAPTAEPTAIATSSPSADDLSMLDSYLDDRSTPTGLLQSYFNAIDRREYLRAYSYWRDPATTLGSFDKFQKGYENTTSVELTFGQIGGDAGAGQMYYSVPVLLKAHTQDGKTQEYAACYILHLSQPGIQAAPPFIPLNFDRGKATALAAGANASDALTKACSGTDFPAGQPINPAPATKPNDVSKDNYLDDSSSPVEVLSSLFNAVNRKEYARAYSYWENAGTSTQVPSFDKFQQGYANTESVQLTTGKVHGGVGAGQLYFSVPVILKARTTAGVTQTFAGCYQLHLANATIQATPPFRPLAIQSAAIKSVANDANTAALLNQDCTP